MSELYITSLTTTILSIVGSLLLSYYCLRKKRKTTGVMLIFALGVSNLFYSIASLALVLRTEGDDAKCAQTEALLRQLFFVFSIFWTSSIAMLHYKITTPGKEFNQKDFFRKSFVIGFLVSLLLAFL